MTYATIETGYTISKRDSKGKIRVWYCELGYDSEQSAGYRTIAGLSDGKKVTSEWTVCEPKNVGRSNETTAKQQAISEMESAYEHKLTRGYFTSLDDVDSFDKFKPMLAAKYEDHKFDFKTNEYYSQPKLDGIRCIARKDGLWTRQGKPIVSCPHITDYLKVFFDHYPNAILDGELYNHELKDDFNKITSLVRKAKPEEVDFTESAALVEYHVYDVYKSGLDRFTDRDNFVYNQGFAKPVCLVPTRAVSSSEQIDELYGKYLEDGYEGQMIRLNKEYQCKRSKFLLKRKEFLTDEFKVISTEEGQGNWTGHVKRFILEMPDGRQCGAGVRGNQKVLKDLLESGKTPEWATLRYFTPTPDGMPRFPVVVDWGFGERDD